MSYDKKQPTDNTITNDASDSNASTNINHRRNSLKKMAVGTTILGSATASQWSQPIINSVISPAHAQATGLTCTTGSQTFDSPGEFEFIAPDCATQVTVEVRGAGGGSSSNGSIIGGLGGLSTGTFSVNAGEVLTMFVGARGLSSDGVTLVAGGIGFGNGGNGTAGGGGGSAVLQNGAAVVIAGGGGGAGEASRVSSGGSGNGGDSGSNDGGSGAFNGNGTGGGGDVGTGNNGGGDGGNANINGGGGGGGNGGGGSGSSNGGGFGGGGGGGLRGPGLNDSEITGGGNAGDGSITISW